MNSDCPDFDHAIVLGGSLSGLLTARVLSDHFKRVTLIERDSMSALPEARRGQPQAQHLHGLLAAGLNVMTQYFPDLPQALREGGAVVGDFAEGMNWYTHGGHRKPFTMGVEAATMSRPLLESIIRSRVVALPNVKVMDKTRVVDLVSTADKAQVTGIQIESSTDDHRSVLYANFIVDTTGRGSRSSDWLVKLGYEAPPVSEVKVNVGYATRVYRRDPVDPRGKHWTLITPEAPLEKRFGGVFPIEGDRWIASIGGWGGDHAPTDSASFLAFARDLPSSDVYDILRHAEPLSDIIPYKFPLSVRRHYERLKRFPKSYLVLGDAISSFNPTYGQGMTSAALQTFELRKLLAKGRLPQDLARDFFQRTAKVIQIPWQMAVGEDFRFPSTQGLKPTGTDFINRYVTKVHRATLEDEVVCLAFLKVMNLMAPPSSLFHPRILWRVLKPRLAKKRPERIRQVAISE
jgi:2-polyprenyl-6-methoxyphenol hydroxylase-like FAD-dependent oxidoreductase